MNLEDFNRDDSQFNENEEVALKMLPRNEEGMNRLISYLEENDTSEQAWQFLFDNYEDLLRQYGRFEGLKKKVNECFPDDIYFADL